MTPTLLVLAAGVGSRFGAPKQLVPVGPRGATLVEYSIYDAQRAGLQRIVLVVREDMRDRICSLVERRFDRQQVSIVAQDGDTDLADRARRSGRAKPWGTAHAVLVAAAAIPGPFVVVNADDFYGRASYETAAGWLRSGECSLDENTFALVAFPLDATLSSSGGVNRGVCEISPDGWLRSVREVIGIERDRDGGRYVDADGQVRHLAGNTSVSMNMWVFTPRIFPELAKQFETFLQSADENPDRELLLPAAVNAIVAGGRARVRVLAGGGRWCGMTYRDDIEAVRKMIAELSAQGHYPGL